MPAETIDYWRPPGLDGLEVMNVQHSARMWRTVHDQYVLCAVLAGGGRWRYRGAVYESGPGSTCLLEPGEVHQDLELRGPTSRVALFVAPSWISRVLDELGLTHGPRAAVTDDPACFAALRRWTEPPRAADDVAAALHAGLRTVLLRTAGERGEPDAGTRPRASTAVRRARALLHDRFDEPLALDEVAGASGLTKPHLVRAFHAEVGLPPIEYLMHLRVARAREGLRAGHSPAAAALACGFCDQSHLTRWFKKVVGVTPGKYAQPHPSRPGPTRGVLRA